MPGAAGSGGPGSSGPVAGAPVAGAVDGRREVRDIAGGAPPAVESKAPSTGPRHPNITRRTNPPHWLYPAVFLVALTPWLYVVGAIASDFFLGTRHLGSNPIKAAEHFTGLWALRFLMLTLSVTPAVKMLKQGWLIRYRRTFGLFAFFYACTHLLIYAALDVELSWGDMLEDVTDRIYITIGMAAFTLLLLLAITSTKGWIRRLGNRRWTVLHRAVYVIVVLGMIHYWMAVKADVTDPLLFAAIFAALFAWRIWWARRRAPLAE